MLGSKEGRKYGSQDRLHDMPQTAEETAGHQAIKWIVKKRVFLRRLAIASTSNRLKSRKACVTSTQAFLILVEFDSISALIQELPTTQMGLVGTVHRPFFALETLVKCSESFDTRCQIKKGRAFLLPLRTPSRRITYGQGLRLVLLILTHIAPLPSSPQHFYHAHRYNAKRSLYPLAQSVGNVSYRCE